MTITFGKNIAALGAQRNLSRATGDLQGTYQRLSTGQRINRPADDSANNTVIEGLRASTRVMTRGSQNVNDGISLLNIADAALSELSNIATKITELAARSANGVYDNNQRAAIDQEAQALSDEFARIVQTTEFNGLGVLSGGLSEGLSLQAGYGDTGSIFSSIGAYLGTGDFEADLAYTATYSAGNAIDVGDLNGDGIVDIVSGGSTGLSVMLGQGDGTFSESQAINAGGANFYNTALGDIDGDGDLDITAIGLNGGTVEFHTYASNGDGTFASAVTYTDSTAAQGTGIDLADFNGDGILDALVTGRTGASLSHLDLRFGVRLPEPPASFAQCLMTEMGTLPWGVKLLDLLWAWGISMVMLLI